MQGKLLLNLVLSNYFSQYCQMKVCMQYYSCITLCSMHAGSAYSVQAKVFLEEKISLSCPCLALPFFSVDGGHSAVLVSHFSYFMRLF